MKAINYVKTLIRLLSSKALLGSHSTQKVYLPFRELWKGKLWWNFKIMKWNKSLKFFQAVSLSTNWCGVWGPCHCIISSFGGSFSNGAPHASQTCTQAFTQSPPPRYLIAVTKPDNVTILLGMIVNHTLMWPVTYGMILNSLSLFVLRSKSKYPLILISANKVWAISFMHFCFLFDFKSF